MMTWIDLFTTLFLMSSFLSATTGSVITVEVNPNSVQTYLTRSMTLRCYLNDSAASPSGAVIGRDVSQTATDVQFLMSLVVTRNDGEHVASITQVTPAKALTDLSNLNVTGFIDGASGQRGYLELTWSYPSEYQAATYTCEANGMTPLGHNVVFSESAEVTYSPPTLDNLVQHIRDLAVKDDEIMKLLQEKDRQLAAVNVELQEKDKQMAEIKLLANSTHHTETGTIHCGSWTPNWTGSDNAGYTSTVTGHFTTSYVHPPVVFLGVINYSKPYRSGIKHTANFYIDLVSVDTSSFTVRCSTGSNVNTVVDALSVSWLSLSE